MNNGIVVLGSINLDIKVSTAEYPKYGDTATAKSIQMLPGGKGANQAVGVSKLGGNLTFIGAVGEDAMGNQMIGNLENRGINTQLIKKSHTASTGTFIVMLDDKGENTMVGTLGANDEITKLDIENAFSKVNAKVLLLQMETSRESIESALRQAKEKNIFVVLDPAPADGFFEEALQYADCVTPNRQETEKISGVRINTREDAVKAAKIIANKGVSNVVVKMGSEGNVVYHDGLIDFVSSYKVKAVDTVGAGDTFVSALAVDYAKHGDILAAVDFGNKAAALKVSRTGGQDSIPTAQEVIEFS